MQSSPTWRHFPMWIACTAALILAAASLLLFSQPVFAQSTITVTTTADNLENNGDCSLREAIESANNDVGVDACAAGSETDIIILPAGIYTITLAGWGRDNNHIGDYELTGSVQIEGAGADNTSIVAAHVDRIFHVHAEAEVALRGISLSGGRSAYDGDAGGAILNEGHLAIDRSIIAHNSTFNGLSGHDGPGGGIANLGTLILTGTTIRNNITGLADGPNGHWQFAPGGGIYNTGMLRVVQCEITLNEAGNGGGVYNTGQAAIVASTIYSNNTTLEVRYLGPYGNGLSSGAGAGIGNAGGVLELYDSAVFRNYTPDGTEGNRGAGGDGGPGAGLMNDGLLLVANSTIAENRTGSGGGSLVMPVFGHPVGGNGGDGGGLYNTGTALLNNVTIAANSTGYGAVNGVGGGIANWGELRLRNTIVADNSIVDAAGGLGDCAGNPLISLGFNLISSSNCAGVDTTSDRVGVAPHLGPIADFGGPTPTVALLKASPAIDAGSCLYSDQQSIVDDERGVTRPQGQTCDIGAYEFTTVDPLSYEYLPDVRHNLEE